MDKQDNTGYNNTGYNNSGDFNSGNFNTGNYNSGSYNAGNHNVGCYNSGHYNSGCYNSGFAPISYFCSFSDTNRPVYLFNKLAPPNTSSYLQSFIHVNLSSNGNSHVPYKEAWAVAWNKANEKAKNAILSLPNFDQDVFQDITGIDLRSSKAVQEDAPEIVIGGERYKLVKVTS